MNKYDFTKNFIANNKDFIVTLMTIAKAEVYGVDKFSDYLATGMHAFLTEYEVTKNEQR